jgi:16S rRNA (cytosine1402-N4)-methyltransferase
MYREVQSCVEDYLISRDNSKDRSKITYQMLDCTFGGGNHSVPLLKKHKSLRVLGTDLDSRVLEACKNSYADFIKAKRLALEHSNFVHVSAIDPRQSFGKKLGVSQKHDIVLLDLGFSSYQLEDPERGFSYMGSDE